MKNSNTEYIYNNIVNKTNVDNICFKLFDNALIIFWSDLFKRIISKSCKILKNGVIKIPNIEIIKSNMKKHTSKSNNKFIPFVL